MENKSVFFESITKIWHNSKMFPSSLSDVRSRDIILENLEDEKIEVDHGRSESHNSRRRSTLSDSKSNLDVILSSISSQRNDIESTEEEKDHGNFNMSDFESGLLSRQTRAGGLHSSEVEILLLKFGHNTLPEKFIPKWYIFVSQLWEPMPIMIWAAIIIFAGTQNFIDMAILIAIQFANARFKISTLLFCVFHSFIVCMNTRPKLSL